MENTNTIQNEKPIVLTTTNGHRMFYKGEEMTTSEIIKHFLEVTEKKNSNIKYLLDCGKHEIPKFWIDMLIETLDK